MKRILATLLLLTMTTTTFGVELDRAAFSMLPICCRPDQDDLLWQLNLEERLQKIEQGKHTPPKDARPDGEGWNWDEERQLWWRPVPQGAYIPPPMYRAWEATSGACVGSS